MVLLVGNQVARPVCEKGEVNLFFLNLSDLDRHLMQHHPEAPIYWICTNCSKGFSKLHGAKCHIPKCSGSSSQVMTGEFQCEACSMSFGSRRGLSTHELHAHPAVRNIKRRGADPPETTKNWKVEDVALLKGLWEIYKGHKYPNKEISKHLTTKTIDQIKYQRKKLNLVGEGRSKEAALLATEVGCDLVGSGNDSFGSPEGRHEIIIDEGESTHEWRLSLKSEINKPSEVPSVLREVNDWLFVVWDVYKDDREALKERLDQFIRTTLYEFIINFKKHKNHTDSKVPKIVANNRKKNNRNSRKRFSYARCQKLFRECPRRLAYAVINNDQAYLEPARQLPVSEEVRGLYEKLWGQVGSTYVPIPVARAPKLSLTVMFPPITAEDVGERIGKIRKKTAAGPDGLQTDHLTILGLPAILAKIYNILNYCPYFPSVWKENRTTLIPKLNKPSSQVENWRPITISPILCRIFSSIIDGRMRRSTVLNMRQKGFTSESGCKNNIELLNSALNYSKRNNSGMFTIVDISKAFDTVPHAALKPCLARKGVLAPIIDLIGVHCGVIVPELLSVVKRVRKLSLKPGQKLELLVKHIFPRYIYHLLVSPPSDTVLKLWDSEVRQEIKVILHLMPSTATGFFYAPKVQTHRGA